MTNVLLYRRSIYLFKNVARHDYPYRIGSLKQIWKYVQKLQNICYRHTFHRNYQSKYLNS